MCYERLSEIDNTEESRNSAIVYYQKATEGNSTLGAAMFYNDQQPDKIFYQGLAWRKLGNADRANNIFKKLSDYGALHANDEMKIDYFAVSLPNLLIFDDDLNLRNRIHTSFLQGLGALGLQQADTAQKKLDHVLQLDKTHAGSKIHLNMAKQSASVIN